MAVRGSRKKYGVVSLRWRLRFVGAFFLLIFGLIGAKLFDLQFLQYDQIAAEAIEQRLVEYTVPARRGDIRSADGHPFAHNVTLNLIFADPRYIEDVGAVAQAISPVLNIEFERLIELLSRPSAYVVLAQYVEDEQADLIRNLRLPGIVVSPQEKRAYPENTMLSHVIGYVNSEGKGQYGIEQQYDVELRGRDGYIRREQDTSRRPIPIGVNEEREAVDGSTLVLTIDRSVQRIVEENLKRGVEQFSMEHGSIIVMDPLTGAVLAMATYPNYDPNNYGAALYDEEGQYLESGYSIYNNKAVSVAYEPGSVFKVVTMAAGLDSGEFERNDTVFDEGELKIGGWTIRNWDLQAQGNMTLTRCLEVSNNVCMSKIATGIGEESFYRYLEGFGFGQQLGVDLAYEASGFMHSLSNWGEIRTATSGFGQGITVTPIQMASAVATIANRGRMVRPYVVQEKIIDNDVVATEPQVLRQVVSRETAEEVTRMMVSVVERSEGRQAVVPGYRIAGKTGTAQVARQGEGGYESDIVISSFAGYAPAEAPKFLVLVKFRTSNQTHRDLRWGSQTAAPVFREVARELFKYYEIPPVSGL